jgi:hypothetical protein
MARSAFIVPKEGRWAGDSAGVGLPLLGTFRRLPKVLNCTEDAHIKGMSTFETDEHLQGKSVLTLKETDRSTMRTSSRAFARCADARAVREFGRWLASHRQPPLPFALPGFPELSGVEEADQHGSGRYLHTNSTIATEARFHILDSGIFPFYSSEWPRFK